MYLLLYQTLFQSNLSVFHFPLQFYCPPQHLAQFEGALSNYGRGIEVESVEIAYIPSDRTHSVEDEVEQQVKELVQDLEENDDTLRVWTTLDFTTTWPEQ